MYHLDTSTDITTSTISSTITTTTNQEQMSFSCYCSFSSSFDIYRYLFSGFHTLEELVLRVVNIAEPMQYTITHEFLCITELDPFGTLVDMPLVEVDN